LYNTGKVAFPFEVDLSQMAHPKIVQVYPMSGIISGYDRQRFIVMFTPGIAERVSDQFIMKIGPFPPEHISIGGTGIFPQINMSLDAISGQPVGPTGETYVCDFGNVIVGQSRKRTFTVTNIGYYPVTYELDKKLLSNAGIVVEPDSIRDLPGHPEPESVEVSVTFQSRANDELGSRIVDVPFRLAEGPIYTVQMRVNITIPEINMINEKLDFGDIILNRCKMMYVQLHNPKEVPCEWSVGKQMGPAAKDSKFFKVEPMSGVLAPGSRCNVEVTFTPTEGRSYMTRIPIKVAHNPQKYHIACRGQATELALSFSPQNMDHTPILPHSSGATTELIVRNDTCYPIEVFSVDFDTKVKCPLK